MHPSPREELLPSVSELESYFDRLWPICRSLTGNGFRHSLKILGEIVPWTVAEIATGTRVFDWTIPREWNVSEAYLEDESGQRVLDFRVNNLHVMGYSVPVDRVLTLDELQPHLYSLPDQPDAIPYLTSYYAERWGFCLTQRQRDALRPGRYRALIRSTLADGHLTLADCVLPSTTGSTSEIMLSSYLCHPSMANNELSGPLTLAFLYRSLANRADRHFNYRFVIVPETIGAIAYLSREGERLKRDCRAGFVVTCCGDDRTFTYKQSREGNLFVDRISQAVLRERGRPHQVVPFFPSGSDERQYCSPGFNLPFGSLMRSMYGTYPEYHTSLDDKSVVSMAALRETIDLYLDVFDRMEASPLYVNTVPFGEPMLGPRGLYTTLGGVAKREKVMDWMRFLLNFADGRHELAEIARRAGCSVDDLVPIVDRLKDAGLLVRA